MTTKKTSKSFPRTFLVDHMLGKLAKYLRILGFDTLYFNKPDFNSFLKKASKEKRIILTRNTKIVALDSSYNFLLITRDQPIEQLGEVIEYFDIKIELERCLTRCLCCNQELKEVTTEEVEEKVPPYIFSIHQEFFFCPQCKRAYWPGTHQKNMEKTILKIVAEQNRFPKRGNDGSTYKS
ncbi:MAG: Mut7-C RNAse domain-containing protein [Desulfobacterota bacterium]|nr:Mut7-C RNAse domain-containing protein [Thermodesulfobacteriota bacterium]